MEISAGLIRGRGRSGLEEPDFRGSTFEPEPYGFSRLSIAIAAGLPTSLGLTPSISVGIGLRCAVCVSIRIRTIAWRAIRVHAPSLASVGVHIRLRGPVVITVCIWSGSIVRRNVCAVAPHITWLSNRTLGH